MTGEADLSARLCALGIQEAQCTLSVSHDDLAGGGVVAHVVRIVELLDALNRRQRSRVENIDAVGAAVGHE